MNKLKRKVLSVLLTFAMLVSLVPIGAVPALAEETGLKVSGGTENADYSYENNTLTILQDTALTISGTTSQDRVVVAEGVDAHLTLDGASITFTDGFTDNGYDHATDAEAGTCALAVGDGSSLALTLSGENTLQSGAGRAGIFVAEGADLVIDGDGSLSATGGHSAAGIGGDAWNNAGEIAIAGGTITATGGVDGAGIGGGHANDAAKDAGGANHLYGGYESITISGSDVTAVGTRNAAGIGTGCWAQKGGPIVIENATVYAECTGDQDNWYKSGGIGCGYSNQTEGVSVEITNSFVNVLGMMGHIICGFEEEPAQPTITDSLVQEAGSSITVYGKYTLTNAINVDNEYAPLIVPEGSTLTIAEGATFVNTSTIKNEGTITGAGSIDNTNGMIYGVDGISSVNIIDQNLDNQTSQTYLDADGKEQTCSSFKNVGTAGNSWTEGWYVVTGDRYLDDVITVSGDVRLILADDSELYVDNNILLEGEDTDLTVYAASEGEERGALSVVVGIWDSLGAAVGSAHEKSCGNITFNGGEVRVVNFEDGAVIGSGENGRCGDITINGGSVYAVGYGWGAGIGGGDDSDCGDITINGGEVIAYGGQHEAGIGCGFSRERKSTCGQITITGGSVFAAGDNGASGIGSGVAGECEGVLIEGGHVTAVGSDYISKEGKLRSGSGIGNGHKGYCYRARITGGSVFAFAGEGAEPITGIESLEITSPNVVEIDEDGTTTFWSDTVTLQDDAIVPSDRTLTVPDGKTLVVPANVTLTIDGEVNGNVVYEMPPEPSTDVSEIFLDVAPDAWYIDAVQWAYDNGLMTGVSDTEFAPETTTTRAMIVSMLARLEGITSAESAGFADVADTDWYATAVNWAAANNIVSGTGENTFSPDAAITREQLAAMLMNYAAYKGEDVSARIDLAGYTDAASVSDWAGDVMSWAVAEGLLTGVTADTLQPQGAATRAQVAAILQRFLDA